MRRIRRITVEVVRQRLVVQAGADSAATDAEPGADRRVSEISSGSAEPCPVCGGEWVVLDGGVGDGGLVMPPGLQAVLANCGVHLQDGEDGRLRVCGRSLQRVAERWKDSG